MTLTPANALLMSAASTAAGAALAFEIAAGEPCGDASFLTEASRGDQIILGWRAGQPITGVVEQSRKGMPQDVYSDVDEPKKAHEVVLRVEENGTAGRLHFFLTPQETLLFEINTQAPDKGRQPMKKGAGTVLLTWLATQAALRGVLFAVTGIENFKVADILYRQGLIAAKTGRVGFYHSFDEGRYTCMKRFSLDNETVLYGYQKRRLEYPRNFLLISGQPNPRLPQIARITPAAHAQS